MRKIVTRLLQVLGLCNALITLASVLLMAQRSELEDLFARLKSSDATVRRTAEADALTVRSNGNYPEAPAQRQNMSTNGGSAAARFIMANGV